MFKLDLWLPRTELEKPMFTPNIKYDFTLKDIADSKSKFTLTPQWDVKLVIYDANTGMERPYVGAISLHEKMLWLAAHFCDSIGVSYMWDKNEFNYESMKNRNGQLIFKLDNYMGKDGIPKTSLKFKDFVKREERAATATQEAPNFPDDDIPF